MRARLQPNYHDLFQNHAFLCIFIRIMINFEWDETKNKSNQKKHHVSFDLAQFAFADPNRIIQIDESHSSTTETRYLCIGKIPDGIVTVRFTYRKEKIRIFGAGFWRKERRTYEKRD